jgi:hypothetical protein
VAGAPPPGFLRGGPVSTISFTYTVRYVQAVAAAPPGSERFRSTDLARLSRATLNLLLQPGPAAPPLEDVAAALAPTPDALYRVASALAPARGERLLRLSQRPLPAEAREAAARRLVRGLFWFLAYELEPVLWDRLAQAEPIHPALVEALPVQGQVLEVAAGSGRLTALLEGRARILVAVEPCPPLRRLLRQRCPGAHVAAGAAHCLPVVGGWADLVCSCAALGPDPPLGGDVVRGELERCCRPQGTVALVSPEDPAWWQRHGYEMREFPILEVRLEPDLEAFFGPPHPPHVLLLKRMAA